MKTIGCHHERGVALIQTILILALLLAMVMGISLTAISELGVSNTYATQTIAFQAAEAGLNHAASLVKNYTGGDFSSLLARRGSTFNTNYLLGNNPFTNAAYFTSGATLIPDEDANRGYQLRDGVTGAVVNDAYYRVSLIDDEPSTSTTLPKVPNFNPGVTYQESTGASPNNANTDQNNKVVIYSTGTYNNASVTLEGWIAFLPYPAMISNKPITISGNAQLLGAYGGVHSNESLDISGSPYIAQTATATGTVNTSGGGWQIDGFHGGLQPRIALPSFITNAPLTSGGPVTSPRIPDFIVQRADVLLIDPSFANGAHENDSNGSDNGGGNAVTQRLKKLADQLNVPYVQLATALDSNITSNKVQQTTEAAVQITRPAPTTTVPNPIGTATRIATVSDTGWSYGSSSWSVPPSGGSSIDGYTFYVIGQDNYDLSDPEDSSANGGNVTISGNLGGSTRTVSILTTGSIVLTGNSKFTANIRDLSTPELPPFVTVDVMLLAVQDVKIRGDVDAALEFNGIVYAGEQFDLSGNGSFNGQVMSYGNDDTTGSPVSANIETGSFTLSLNNGNSYGNLKLISWRQIKR